MPSALLTSLIELIQEDLDGVAVVEDGLRAVADARYGEVAVRLVHDEEAEAIRVQISVPPPAGAGPGFLVWCLATNVEYWDVKIGLDEDGTLALHADLEAGEGRADKLLAEDVIDRVESLLELLDEDLTEHLLESGLGTPKQRERWEKRRPSPERDEEGEEE